jgi:hypothetical protein
MAQQLGLQLDDDVPAPQPRPRRSFHLRSHATVEEAQAGERRAARQEDAILALFRMKPGLRLAPSGVHSWFPQWLLTSVRRALTNLSTVSPDQPEPPLRHYPADRRPGPHGAKESTWGLA